MIPAEAVEAAAKAIDNHMPVAQSETTLHISCTCHMRLYTSDLAAHQARAALEAAAPYMLAEAWDEGWDTFAGFDSRPGGPYPANPYRSAK